MVRFEKRAQALSRRGKLESLSVMTQPSQIFDIMIRPRTSTAIKGVLWYRGKSTECKKLSNIFAGFNRRLAVTLEKSNNAFCYHAVAGFWQEIGVFK
jgi:hypothetical protein